MSRIETKFLLNFAQYEYFKERCNILFQRDSNSLEQNSYPIISAYFDTPDLKFFYQKINGEFYHTKIRLRCYSHQFSPDAACFLEVKYKENDNQKKIRIPIKYNKQLLDSTSWFGLDNPEIDHLLMKETNLVHTINVYYEREAFEWCSEAEGKVRLNFDTNFAALPRNQFEANPEALAMHRLLPDNKIILEIKTPGFKMPQLLKNELKTLGVEQERVSKYIEAIISTNDRINLNEAIA